MPNILTSLIKSKKRHTGLCSIYINNDGLSMAVTESTETPRIVINHLKYIPFNEKPTFESITLSIESFAQDNNLKSIPTICVLSREMYRLLLIDIPNNIPENEYTESAKWIIKDLIDFPVDDLASDVILIPDQNQTNKKAYVCVARKHMLNIRQQQIISSELNLTQMSISDLTLCSLVHNTNKDQMSLIVSITSNHSALILSKNQKLYLKHDLDLTCNKSEPLSEKALNQLVQQMNTFINYYFNNDNNINIQIVILPTLSHSDTILSYLNDKTHYSSNILDLNSIFSFPENTDNNIKVSSTYALSGITYL